MNCLPAMMLLLAYISAVYLAMLLMSSPCYLHTAAMLLSRITTHVSLSFSLLTLPYCKCLFLWVNYPGDSTVPEQASAHMLYLMLFFACCPSLSYLYCVALCLQVHALTDQPALTQPLTHVASEQILCICILHRLRSVVFCQSAVCKLWLLQVLTSLPGLHQAAPPPDLWPHLFPRLTTSCWCSAGLS